MIFGILGVTMVSLFTTATTSSATPNDARRACLMAESATRYAFSELRRSGFSATTINDLNSTTYSLSDTSSFTLRVLGLGFKSVSEQSANPYTLITTNNGRMPPDFEIPANRNVWIINFEYLEDTDDTGSRSPVSACTRVDDTTLTINVTGDFSVGGGKKVLFGVMPAFTQGPLDAGDDLYVERVAKDFFPRFNGAVNINRIDYSYERLIDEPANSRVKLKNLTAFRLDNTDDPFPLTVARTFNHGGNFSGDFIALSNVDYTVVATGLSDATDCGNEYESGLHLFNPTENTNITALKDIEPDEITDNINPLGTDPNVITVNPDDDTLNVGGNHTPGPAADFGAGWYSGNQSIGGDTDVCNTGACLFGRGVRVFFTFNYTGDGDGFTFTMMNADPTDGNDVTSIGGDPQGSELLAYAGDSREDLIGTAFLDNNGGRGIVPPKLAVEFDSKTNFDQNFEDEDPKNYCNNPTNLRQDTRNDPLPGGTGADRDTVQFVYWGDRNLPDDIMIQCRANSNAMASYDDNRHAPSADPADPANERDLYLTADELEITPSDNWLNDGPWAVRIEVERNLTQNADGNYEYNLQLWMRQCAQSDCNDILGTFFQDTRNKYDYSALADLPLTQEIELSQSDHDRFIRFLFGFTTATAPGDSQSALIEHFNLSFIRPNDPVITNDPAWPPP